MIRWEKVAKSVHGDGTTVIQYQGIGTDFMIESRKEQIPHANRSGSWAHTHYTLIRDGKPISERSTLSSAKEVAEELLDFEYKGGDA